MTQVLSIAVLGAAGAVSRFALQRIAVTYGIGATAFINVLGSFLIGVVAVGLERRILGSPWGIALAAGFLGGFTTFSTFSLEALGLLDRRNFTGFLLYFVGSPLLGLAAAWFGMQLGRTFWKV